LSEAKRSEKDTVLPKRNSGSGTREAEPKLEYKSNRNSSQAADLEFKNYSLDSLRFPERTGKGICQEKVGAIKSFLTRRREVPFLGRCSLPHQTGGG